MSTRAFEDGVPLKRRTAKFEFRTRFKDAIMCANAAGLPRAGASIASTDACGDFLEWEVLY